MFTLQSGTFPGPDEGFGRPVESIMRCEDFKSNFARRLSNRYISRTPVTFKREDSLKIKTAETKPVINAPERTEQCSQLSKTRVSEQSGEIVKPPDKITKNIRDTEVSALNLEIETLRWQLSQTEANRQMHIALLKQVVTFLSRVKERIDCQTPEAGTDKDADFAIDTPTSTVTDLPRSKSVLHVNKPDYTLNTGKKLSARKISKSISNVTGFKEYNGVWSPSKLSLSPSDSENAQKLTEEISRLISLANSVLCTKLPDLACKCIDSSKNIKGESINRGSIEHNQSNTSLNGNDDTTNNSFILNTIYDSEDAFSGHTNEFEDIKDKTLTEFEVTSSEFICDTDIDYSNGSEKDEIISHDSKPKMLSKRSEYKNVSNFIEDESGFSSMSSFQEIGIPIISIIPPSPCKEVGYIEELTDILDGSEKWKSDSMDINKQTVKVFWV